MITSVLNSVVGPLFGSGMVNKGLKNYDETGIGTFIPSAIYDENGDSTTVPDAPYDENGNPLPI